jgi:orotate phosphoribosyltransferase
MLTKKQVLLNSFIKWAHEQGVLWQFNGERPEEPHAVLTSGLHSDGFFNGTVLIQDAALLAHVSISLKDMIKAALKMSPYHFADRVVGPAFGAIPLAHELAASVSRGIWGFTEPIHIPGGEDVSCSQGIQLKRFNVNGEAVVVIEDVITTGGSLRDSIKVLEKAGAIVLPFVLCVANRSGYDMLDDRRIVSLVDLDFGTWPANDCPLCAEGSEALRPKAHWSRFTPESENT